MSDFNCKHFVSEIILGCVRRNCSDGISYRDLGEMMQERGVEVDYSTWYRWVQPHAPDIEKRLFNSILGFKSMKTDFAPIKGLEVMRMLEKGQFDVWRYNHGLMGEICPIERLFQFS